MSDYFDFDAALEEERAKRQEEGPRVFKYTFMGEKFEANMSPNAGKILRWMAESDRLQAIPRLMQALHSDDDYERLLNLDCEWKDMEFVVTKLAEELGGQGNSPQIEVSSDS